LKRLQAGEARLPNRAAILERAKGGLHKNHPHKGVICCRGGNRTCVIAYKTIDLYTSLAQAMSYEPQTHHSLCARLDGRAESRQPIARSARLHTPTLAESGNQRILGQI